MNATTCICSAIALALLFGGLIAGPAAAANDTGNDADWDEGWWIFGGLAAFICLVPLAIFIIGIAIAVWVYRDAEKRGESGALWLIINILAPIIGLIIWIIVRPEVGEKKEEQRGERYCPSCGRGIPFDAQVCPYCGTSLE